MSDRELRIDPNGCEECGKHPAWDFPLIGSLCAACAGLEGKPESACGLCEKTLTDGTICHNPQCPGKIKCGGGQRW